MEKIVMNLCKALTTLGKKRPSLGSPEMIGFAEGRARYLLLQE